MSVARTISLIIHLYRTYLVFNVSYVIAHKPLENTIESPRQALLVFHFW